MEAGSRRCLVLRPSVNSMCVLPLKVTCVFLTVVHQLVKGWVVLESGPGFWKRYPRVP